jgi:hypothetical protein
MKNLVCHNLPPILHRPLFFHSGLNQIGHFNTENITKLTKTKQAISPIEEPEVC